MADSKPKRELGKDSLVRLSGLKPLSYALPFKRQEFNLSTQDEINHVHSSMHEVSNHFLNCACIFMKILGHVDSILKCKSPIIAKIK